MPPFTAHVVPPDQVRTVYPLVREAVPGLDLKSWVRFAEQIARPRRGTRSGIVAVTRRGRAMPCGVFLYRCEQQLPAGATMVAEHFVAVDVLDPGPVMRALIAELDSLAERLGCTAIRVLVPGEDSLLHAGLQAAGHRPRAVALVKEAPAVPPVGGGTAG